MDNKTGAAGKLHLIRLQILTPLGLRASVVPER